MNTAPSISRRRFAQLLGTGAAVAAMRPPISFARRPIISTAAKADAAGIVRLSSNENPYGPSASALQAMKDAFSVAWRYPDEQNDRLINSLAKENGVAADEILLGDGSSEILQLCALAFTGPDPGANKETRGNLVVADPTFEAIAHLAEAGGADVVKIPLTPSFVHDLPQMATAAKGGLIYICNPNNPTASITPKGELRAFIESTPQLTTILVDEAYFHFAESPEHESVIPLIKDHPNLIVARTFSKIYGMAGLRCGYAVAPKETLARMRPHQVWDSVNCIALAAAIASLDDREQVANGRRLNSEVKGFITSELEAMGFKSIPSQANFIMVDLQRPVASVIAALKQRKVQVGRLFPTLPNHLRVTIGKKAEMQAFLAAFREVVA